MFGWTLVSGAVLAIGATGCGDDGGALPSELFGTWDAVSLEAEGMSTPCPGEIDITATDSVSCGTEATTFNADGTLVVVETTDELGDPFDWRQEGTWSTSGNTLTETVTREGPDASNLQAVDPPDVSAGTFRVSGSTLTVSVTSPSAPPVTVTGTLQQR